MFLQNANGCRCCCCCHDSMLRMIHHVHDNVLLSRSRQLRDQQPLPHRKAHISSGRRYINAMYAVAIPAVRSSVCSVTQDRTALLGGPSPPQLQDWKKPTRPLIIITEFRQSRISWSAPAQVTTVYCYNVVFNNTQQISFFVSGGRRAVTYPDHA